MIDFLGSILMIVAFAFVATAFTVFCGCLVAGVDALELDRRKEDL